MDSNFWFLPERRRADSEHFLKDACGEAARLGVEPLHYTAGIETSSIAAAASVGFGRQGIWLDRTLGGATNAAGCRDR
jgi:hypothetical protein